MIDIRIVYSHRLPVGDEFYDVFANNCYIGKLSNMLSPGYTFRPLRNAPINNIHTFGSLNDALERLPDYIIKWLALVTLQDNRAGR